MQNTANVNSCKNSLYNIIKRILMNTPVYNSIVCDIEKPLSLTFATLCLTLPWS